MESIAVLIFGLAVIGLEVYMLVKKGQGLGWSTIRMVGVTLVLTIGMFLGVSSQSQDHFGQSLGFLGTIAGYLLGRSDSQSA
jgi:hypothetical protein